MKSLITGIVLCSLTAATTLYAATTPPLPKKYTSWNKSPQKIVTDKKSLFYGIHYLYGDTKAMQGYRAGNQFAEGSTLIVEHFTIKNGAKGPEIGSKNMVVLMRKDKRMKETGGWLFAGYGADGKPSGLDPKETCFGCHLKEAAQRNYVISTIKDFTP